MFFNKNAKLLKDAEEEILGMQTKLFQTTEELEKSKSEIAEISRMLEISKEDADQLLAKCELLQNKYAHIVEIDKVVEEKKILLQETQNDCQLLNEKYSTALAIFLELEKKMGLYQEELEISEYGLYQPRYSYEFPENYKLELENVYQLQKQMVSSGEAIKCFTEWVVGGSATEGKKMTKLYTKLMLYAFNGECDAIIAKVKWNNVVKMEQRIRNAFESVNKLGVSHNISITVAYMDLKLKELYLSYEYEQKKYEEKEEQRRIREQMREEEKAQKEFERAQKEAEEDERRYQKALDKARQDLGSVDATQMEELNNKIQLLEKNLQEAHDNKERVISMAQMTKVGHIYVISNIGSFGEDVYKIGMTRRLDPQDRIRELGDASVPFHFDVHAIIYSDNAPQMEYEFHQNFKDRRINLVNQRKEFFRLSLDDIEAFVKQHANAEIVFTKLAEAREYRETMSLSKKLTLLATESVKPNTFPQQLL